MNRRVEAAIRAQHRPQHSVDHAPDVGIDKGKRIAASRIGALLDAVAVKNVATKEGWRKRGAAFFQGKTRKAAPGTQRQSSGTLPLDSGAASA
ncbi:MAG: hypothetical protein ABI240_18850 [Sphingomonas sp.]